MRVNFANGQRVRVIDTESLLVGKAGTVVRLLRRSNCEAWVRMDEPLPPEMPEMQVFPEGDERARDVVLYDDECGVIS